MSAKSEVMLLVKEHRSIARERVFSMLPGFGQSTLNVALRRLVAEGYITVSGLRGHRFYAMGRKRFGEKQLSHIDRLLLKIEEAGGKAKFGQLRQLMQMTPTMLSATIVAARQSGRVTVTGDKRLYWYSAAPGANLPPAQRKANSVFDLGRLA